MAPRSADCLSFRDGDDSAEDIVASSLKYMLDIKRACVVAVAAVSAHLALSVPRTELSALETTAEDVQRVRCAYQPIWLGVGVRSWKAVIWCSTAFELAAGYIDAKERIASSFLREFAPDLSCLSSAGLVLLVAGAATQVAARTALGPQASFPILPGPPAARQLYTPKTVKLPVPLSPHARGGDTVESRYTLRPKHALVTAGPYGWIRHPMFAAFTCGTLGSACFYLSSASPFRSLIAGSLHLVSQLPGAPLRDVVYRTFRLESTAWKYCGITALCFSLVKLVAQLQRMIVLEEEALEAHFGGRWKAYRWSVRSAIFPRTHD